MIFDVLQTVKVKPQLQQPLVRGWLVLKCRKYGLHKLLRRELVRMYHSNEPEALEQRSADKLLIVRRRGNDDGALSESQYLGRGVVTSH